MGKEQRDTVARAIREIIAETLLLEVSEVKDESSFIEDLGGDSLDLIEIIVSVEDKFEIVIPDDKADKITTVGQAIDLVLSLIAAKTAP
jgi:acyl carrier protein